MTIVTDTTTAAPAPAASAPAAAPAAAAAPAGDAPGLLGTETAPVAEAKLGEGDPAAKPGDPVKAVAPEYKFVAPEGVEFDAPSLEKFTALAKELNLSPENAQKAVDLVSQMEVQRVQQHTETVKGWLSAVKADAELGGDKLAENLAVAKKTFSLLPEAMATELKGLLNQTGLEAHPVFFRLFHAVGKALSEDKFVPSGRAAAPPKTQAERLYPSSTAA